MVSWLLTHLLGCSGRAAEKVCPPAPFPVGPGPRVEAGFCPGPLPAPHHHPLCPCRHHPPAQQAGPERPAVALWLFRAGGWCGRGCLAGSLWPLASLSSSEAVSWAWSQALLLKAGQGSKAVSTCGPVWPRAGWGTDELGGECALSRGVFVSRPAAASSGLRDCPAVCGGCSLAAHAYRVCSFGLLPTECPADMSVGPQGSCADLPSWCRWRSRGARPTGTPKVPSQGPWMQLAVWLLLKCCLCLCEKPPGPSLTGSPRPAPCPPGPSSSHPPGAPAPRTTHGPPSYPQTPRCRPGAPQSASPKLGLLFPEQRCTRRAAY